MSGGPEVQLVNQDSFDVCVDDRRFLASASRPPTVPPITVASHGGPALPPR